MEIWLRRDDFFRAFLDGVQWIDVRSPIEFEQASLPNSVNLPLLTTEERHEVGLCYKKFGAEKAIELGHKLVDASTRAPRIQSWIAAAEQRPSVILCARGGLRSKIAQEWCAEKGLSIPRVEGGYKSLRNFLLHHLECSVREKNWIVLSGRTGSGKTRLLKEQNAFAMDFEALAKHRGSAFGRLLDSQPSQARFENEIAKRLIELSSRSTIFVEDESASIGRVHLPPLILRKIQSSLRIVLEASIEDRIENIFQEYVIQERKLQDASGVEDPDAEVQTYLIESLRRISQKLGGLRTRELEKKIRAAFAQGLAIQNSKELHRAWIEPLLIEYYDPIYERGIQKAKPHELFRGIKTEVKALIEKFEIDRETIQKIPSVPSSEHDRKLLQQPLRS